MRKKKKSNLEAIKDVPQTAAVEYALSSSKIALSLVPIIGSTLSEIISSGVSAILNKRRSIWEDAVVRGFEELYGDHQAEVERILQDETFVSTLQHASQAAIRTHQDEKRISLRNAVLNSALPDSPDEDLQQMFLTYIDSFTAWHLRILKILDQDSNIVFHVWGEKSGYLELLDREFGDSRPGNEVCIVIADDLITKGLASSLIILRKVGGIWPASYPQPSATTSLGRQFLEFVSSPLD